MSEKFRNIPEFDDYMIGNKGTVLSYKKGSAKELKPHTTRGYKFVALMKDGKRYSMTIHKLIAMAYLNYKPNGKMDYVIDHINEDKKDNRVENIQILTCRENLSKSIRGTSKYNGVSWNKKLGKWMAYVYLDKKLKYLGYFDDELQAYNTHLKALE